MQVRYHDLSDPQVQAEHQEILAVLREERLPLPAVFLDGVLLCTGAINPLRVVASVAQEWQRRAHAPSNSA